MSPKYSFPEPDCQRCPHHQAVGPVFNPTRYCGGFKRKKPKRFRTTDPLHKPPKWCPKRVSPPICRIYGFANEQCQLAELMCRNDFDPKARYIYPIESHYLLRRETTIGMTARRFFQAAQEEPLEELLHDEDLSFGEIIEIDDGLQPYFFYYFGFSRVIPAPIFRPMRVTKTTKNKEEI